MTRICLKYWYLGTHFSGSQRQPNLRTIEGEILSALVEFKYIQDQTSGRIIFAARTDAGVHAKESALVFNSEKPIYLQEINSGLPKDIGIMAWASVPKDFNPRHHVIWKEYHYFFPHPLGENECNYHLMARALRQFAGSHDFHFFTKYDPRRPLKDTRMDFMEARMERNSEGTTFIFRNKFFLWQQIRRMVSFILKIGLGEKSIEDLEHALDSPSSELDKTQKIGPLVPDGLVLWKFQFPPEIKFIYDPKSSLRNRRLLAPFYSKTMQQAAAIKNVLDEKR